MPSAVTKGDYNLLINPAHPDFKKIKIKGVEKFPFDRRIFQ
ncbi:MAG: RES family NAD+ phosphorylase [Chitinophagaceae bacterium]